MVGKSTKAREVAVSQALNRHKTAYNRRLNEIHIETQVLTTALKRYAEALKAGAGEKHKGFYNFEVPSGNKPTARIRRTPSDLRALLAMFIDQGV